MVVSQGIYPNFSKGWCTGELISWVTSKECSGEIIVGMQSFQLKFFFCLAVPRDRVGQDDTIGTATIPVSAISAPGEDGKIV